MKSNEYVSPIQFYKCYHFYSDCHSGLMYDFEKEPIDKHVAYSKHYWQYPLPKEISSPLELDSIKVIVYIGCLKKTQPF